MAHHEKAVMTDAKTPLIWTNSFSLAAASAGGIYALTDSPALAGIAFLQPLFVGGIIENQHAARAGPSRPWGTPYPAGANAEGLIDTQSWFNALSGGITAGIHYESFGIGLGVGFGSYVLSLAAAFGIDALDRALPAEPLGRIMRVTSLATIIAAGGSIYSDYRGANDAVAQQPEKTLSLTTNELADPDLATALPFNSLAP